MQIFIPAKWILLLLLISHHYALLSAINNGTLKNEYKLSYELNNMNRKLILSEPIESKLIASDASDGAGLGISVCMTANYVVSGAYGEKSSRGI